MFDAWLEDQQISSADISVIGQPLMEKFMLFIINDLKRSKSTVDNYRILLDAVFKFVKKKHKIFQLELCFLGVESYLNICLFVYHFLLQ
jgi:hypothetical protein